MDYMKMVPAHGIVQELNNEEIDWIKYTFDIHDSYTEYSPFIRTPTAGAGLKRTLSDMTENSFFSYDGEDKPIAKKSKGVQRALELNDDALSASPKSDNEGEVKIGRWKKNEMAILLFVAKTFIKGNLKVIGDVCLACGVNRPRRAIDKQLKRMLQYERWSKRNMSTVSKTIDAVIAQRGLVLSVDAREKLDQAVEEQAKLE